MQTRVQPDRIGAASGAHPPAAPAASAIFDVRLGAEQGIPVYQQLADQIRLLTVGGQLPAGVRLPAARNLAANLGINRNTVLKAYAVLALEGIVAGRRGGGTVVVRREPRASEPSELPVQVVARVKDLLQLATELRVQPAELLSYVERQARLREVRSTLRVGFVECNPDSLGYFVGRLTDEFGITVEPILLQDLGVAVQRRGFAELDCVVSTFFHLSEVRRILRDAGVGLELLAIGVRTHLSVLDALKSLHRGSEVGVVYYEKPGDAFARDRLTRMTDGVRHASLRDISVRSILIDRVPDSGVFEGLDAIVIRPENVAPIRASIPGTLTVIEFLNDLDDASQAYLRDVFEDLARRHRSGRARGG